MKAKTGRPPQLILVPCPKCGAREGERCRSRYDRPIPNGHRSRRTAAGLCARSKWAQNTVTTHSPPRLWFVSDFDCASCGAKRGSPCVSRTGEPYAQGHVARRRLAGCTPPRDRWRALAQTALSHGWDPLATLRRIAEGAWPGAPDAAGGDE